MFNIQLYLTVTGNKIMLKIEENFLCICILHPLCIKEKQGWVFFFSFLFLDVIWKNDMFWIVLTDSDYFR